jgi:peptidylprolyl isomerase
VKLSPRPSHRSLSRKGAVLLAAGLLVPATLAACSSGSSSSAASAASSAGKSATTKVGVAVTGGFGEKPTLTVPSTPAPTALTTDILKQGDGPVVAKGQTLVVNYLGQTWAPKDGKPNVFDNSYDRKQAAGFPIGVQGLIAGWNKTLVGQKAGTRLLLTVPPADGYGTAKDPNQPLAGETLLFVVDVLASYDKGTTATGQPAGALPAGFPQVTSAPGTVPAVTGVKGVDAKAKEAKSALLIKGAGAPIDASKSLVLQLLQADPKTGKTTQSSWTADGPQVIPASSVLPVVSAFKGANVGSRAVVVTPATAQEAAAVLVVDVIGEH